MKMTWRHRFSLALAALFLLSSLGSPAEARKKKQKKEAQEEDPYAEYVWPPPPDEARIKLEDILFERTSVEGSSSFQRTLIGLSDPGRYDRLLKPWGVAIDDKERILVTDTTLGAVIRFDRTEGRMDVLGTQGSVKLQGPLGLGLGPDERIYVADAAAKRVVAFEPDGKIAKVYGEPGELLNPTDAEVSPDGTRLYVADSKAHQIKVFSIETAALLDFFGSRGDGETQFNFPTSLAFDDQGQLLVVDQMNARIQVLDQEGEYVDSFGGLGTGFGNFARPKDIAVDEVGFIYVTDVAFNNLQLFDYDYTLLTFVGTGGRAPGTFNGAAGVAARGDLFVVADQQNRRVQVFRFLGSKGGE